MTHEKHSGNGESARDGVVTYERAASNDELDEVVQFGKYRGRRWRDLDLGYLGWMVREGHSHAVTARRVAIALSGIGNWNPEYPFSEFYDCEDEGGFCDLSEGEMLW